MNVRAAFIAGVVAAVVSTVAQMTMWVAFTNAFPAILWRDTRFAAAIVLGSGALSDTSVLLIVTTATFIHFALSIVYALLLGIVIHRRVMHAALLIGTLSGAAIYVVNMYAFTAFFPWFVESRDAITLAAHIVFGATAAFVYRRLDGRLQPARLRDRNP